MKNDTDNFDNFEVIIKERGGFFYLYLKEFNLIAKADSLENAHSNLKSKFITHLVEIEEAGLTEKNHNHNSFIDKREIGRFVTHFSLATLIITFGLALLVAFTSSVIKYHSHKAERKIETAFKPVEQDKQAERLDRFRAKINVLKPYVKEIQLLFDDKNEK